MKRQDYRRPYYNRYNNYHSTSEESYDDIYYLPEESALRNDEEFKASDRLDQFRFDYSFTTGDVKYKEFLHKMSGISMNYPEKYSQHYRNNNYNNDRGNYNNYNNSSSNYSNYNTNSNYNNYNNSSSSYSNYNNSSNYNSYYYKEQPYNRRQNYNDYNQSKANYYNK